MSTLRRHLHQPACQPAELVAPQASSAHEQASSPVLGHRTASTTPSAPQREPAHELKVQMALYRLEYEATDDLGRLFFVRSYTRCMLRRMKGKRA